MPDVPAPDPRQVLLEYTEGIHAWNAWLTKTVSPRLQTPTSRPNTLLDEVHPFDLADVAIEDDRSIAIALAQIAAHVGGALESLADALQDSDPAAGETRAAIATIGEGITAQAFVADELLQRLQDG